MEQYRVTGMSCAACQAHVEKAVSKVPGVKSVSVSLLTNSMGVEGTAKSSDIIAAVEKAGYGASPFETEKKSSSGSASAKLAAEEDALKDRTTPRLVRRLKLSVFFLIVLMYITMGHNMWGWPVPPFLSHNHLGLALTQMLLALVVMIINRDFFTSGFKSLFHGAPNMDALVALGSSVSFGWSLYVFYRMTWMVTQGVSNMNLMDLYHNQLYFESAAMIPALITVGKTLESLSKGRTTDALKNLMKMAPKTAAVERDGRTVTVGIDEVSSGDIFVVKPGESIPVDGVIIEGSTAVDESALTGESIPVDKTVDDTVSAATINQSGFIRARATRVGEDTTFSQIIQMVSDAAATKAPIAKIADKVSGVFVPSVIGIAVAVLIGWLLTGHPIAISLEHAITVLVISCPCALGLATPVAIMVGNGVGAKNGILFKTSEALENTGHIQIVALDKTGTITAGRPEVTDIVPADGVTETELLTLAYSLEIQSEHPLAKAVVAKAEEQRLEPVKVTEFRALSGHGLTARIERADDKADGGRRDTAGGARKKDETESGKSSSVLYGGSGQFIGSIAKVPENMRQKSSELASKGKTPLFFEKDGTLLGIIAVADVIKPDSAQAIGELKNMGIETVMLTGDNEQTARAIGAQAGVDRIVAGVLPDGKEEVIRNLQKRGKTAMVGDGINDAPALTRADIGIAIGAGTDVAIDSADVVLMNSKLTDVSGAVRLSRSTIRNIHENLFWAFAYNALLIPMAAGLYPNIHLNPMWGAAAMALSSFTVCMNALRLNLVKVHDASHDHPMRKRALPEEREASENRDPDTGVSGGVSSSDSRKEDFSKKNLNKERETAAGETVMKKESDGDTDAAGAGTDSAEAGTETVLIGGMMCEMCEKHIAQALGSVDGITGVKADHTTGKAVVTFTKRPDEEAMKKAVDEADYEYEGIEKAG